MGINLMVVIHGEYSACSTLQVDSKVNCSLAYELAATWCWATFTRRMQSELSHMASCLRG